MKVQIGDAACPLLSDPLHPDVERAKTLLRPLLPDRFSVIHEPEMPGQNGKVFRWFQVVFAIGPGEAGVLRTQIHELFPRILAALSPLVSVREADVVSLRARRFLSNQDPAFDRPSMFIQAEWTGAVVRQIRKQTDFSFLIGNCLAYRNFHDKADVFNKQPAGLD